jgi:hypothetical protein
LFSCEATLKAQPVEEEVIRMDFHANPIISGPGFEPVHEHKHTEPQPFEVAKKDPMVKRKRLYEETVKAEAMAREFKAHGIPSYSPYVRPVSAKPSTMPEPFDLPGEHISKRKRMDFEEKLKEEEMAKKKAAEFHAQPCESTVVEPFVPQRSDKPLTQVLHDAHCPSRKSSIHSTWRRTSVLSNVRCLTRLSSRRSRRPRCEYTANVSSVTDRASAPGRDPPRTGKERYPPDAAGARDQGEPHPPLPVW